MNKSKFLADMRGGPLLNVDETKPYEFNADVKAGETHAVINGTVTQPFHLDRFTGPVYVSGPTLVGSLFPDRAGAAPYAALSHDLDVVREGPLYRLNDINGMLGGTDLGGNLSVDASKEIPALAGRVASRVLMLRGSGRRGGRRQGARR